MTHSKLRHRLAVALSLILITLARTEAADQTKDLEGLQREVRALRDDVRRLCQLLEKRTVAGRQAGGAIPPRPQDTVNGSNQHAPTEIQSALLKAISLEATDLPLREVLREIQKQININIVIDSTSLLEEGITEKDPISVVVSGVSARSALNLILTPLRLTLIESDNVLKVVSFVRAKGELITAIYPVEELTDKISAPKQLTEIRDLIQKTISPESWEEQGGQGTIKSLEDPRTLVIRQTASTHAEIEDLLQQVRRLKRLPKQTRIPVPSTNTQTGELVVMTYSVADLIVPIPNGPGAPTKVTTSDWLKLTDLITKKIEPDNWASNGGRCSIRTFSTTMSLVIRATHQMHEAIANLLSEMRREQDLQVTIACQFLKVRDNEILYKTGIKIDFDEETGITRLEENDGKKLISAVQSGQGDLVFAPKVTMFNSQIASISDLAEQNGVKTGCQLHIRGNISEDRRSIRLNVATNTAFNSEHLVNELISKSYQVEDGGFLLLDLTDGTPIPHPDSVPIANKDSNLPSGPTGTRRRLVRNLILIQPRIIIQEEEEMLLTKPKKETDSK